MIYLWYYGIIKEKIFSNVFLGFLLENKYYFFLDNLPVKKCLRKQEMALS